jgi:uncharacterized protein YfaP (DUF2135 family)
MDDTRAVAHKARTAAFHLINSGEAASQRWRIEGQWTARAALRLRPVDKAEATAVINGRGLTNRVESQSKHDRPWMIQKTTALQFKSSQPWLGRANASSHMISVDLGPL